MGMECVWGVGWSSGAGWMGVAGKGRREAGSRGQGAVKQAGMPEWGHAPCKQQG